ncbi:hypothetical protein JMUB6875_56040 [Nocardia sp. JMUB6875]
MFILLAWRARSGRLALAALGYMVARGVAHSSKDSHPVLFFCAWTVLVVVGGVHSIRLRPLWTQPAGRARVPEPTAPESISPVSVSQSPVSVSHLPPEVTPEPKGASPEPRADYGRVLDEIDRLVEDSMRDGEPRVGYSYGDPTFPECPNPYCEEPWHGLAITARMRWMRWRGVVDVDYAYGADDSPVLCPGSLHTGEWPLPPAEFDEIDDEDEEEYDEEADAEPADPVDPRLQRAEQMWAAVTHPMTCVWGASIVLGLVSIFASPLWWRWLTPVIGVASLFGLWWLYAYQRRALPPGELRRRLRARPEAVAALVLTVIAAWLPAVWVWRTPIRDRHDALVAFQMVLVTCAVAAVLHAVVHLGRIRPVWRDVLDGEPPLDLSKHAVNLFVFGFFWAVLGIAPMLLVAALADRLGGQRSAVWLVFAVILIASLAYLVEALLVALWTRELGEVLLYSLFVLAAGAALWWMLDLLAGAPMRL